MGSRSDWLPEIANSSESLKAQHNPLCSLTAWMAATVLTKSIFECTTPLVTVATETREGFWGECKLKTFSTLVDLFTEAQSEERVQPILIYTE